MQVSDAHYKISRMNRDRKIHYVYSLRVLYKEVTAPTHNYKVETRGPACRSR